MTRGQRRDLQAGQCRVRLDVDGDLGQQQRVAERDQLVRLLGRHDAGDARGAEHVALLGVAVEDHVQRLGPHRDKALGDRRARRLCLVADIDHVGFALRAEMGEGARHRQTASAGALPVSSRRVAAATSCLPHQAFADEEGADAALVPACGSRRARRCRSR